MSTVEEVARAKCISQKGIWGGAWDNPWSPETLAAAHKLKTPANHLAVEGFTKDIRFKYFVPHRFVSKGGHDVALVNYEEAVA